MPLLNEHQHALSDSQTIGFQNFSVLRKNTNDLYCFYENQDSPYYHSRIARYFQGTQIPVRCGNRNGVLKTHRLIANRSHFAKYKKAFFVDSDFNAPLAPTNPPIFETSPYYSIENCYVSPAVFEKILMHQLHISPPNPLFEQYLNIYKDRQAEFNTAMLVFNAWYACLMDKRIAENIDVQTQLSEKLPRGFLEITIANVTKIYDMEKIYTTFPNAPIIDETILNVKITSFSDKIPYQVFRGKYEFSFLLEMITLLTKHSFDKKQTLGTFSQYAETPRHFEAYMKSVL
jgi:Protein of unknown function (DUF4435)